MCGEKKATKVTTLLFMRNVVITPTTITIPIPIAIPTTINTCEVCRVCVSFIYFFHVTDRSVTTVRRASERTPT